MANLEKISGEQLKAELSGGFAAMLVSLPASIGLGVLALAPLGPEYASTGLMAGVLGTVVGTLISSFAGGAPGLISGLSASGALVIATVISALMASGALSGTVAEMQATALLFGFFTVIVAGLFQIAFGLFRLGTIIKFVPQSVVAGFINGTALLLLLSQARVIAEVGPGEGLINGLAGAGADGAARFAIAVVTMLAVFGGRRLVPERLGLFAGLVVGTLAYHGAVAQWPAHDFGGTLPQIAAIPVSPEAGLRFLSLIAAAATALTNGVTGAEALGIAPGALPGVVAIVLAAAVSLALLQSFFTLVTVMTLEDLSLGRYRSNRELTVQGAANVLGAGLGMFAGSGTSPRSIPSYLAGGRTAWSGVFCALYMVVAIALVAPAVSVIPKVVIAGLLAVIGLQLMDRWTMALLRNVEWRDTRQLKTAVTDVVIIVLVIATALGFGLIVAVGVGVGVAILEFVLRMSRSPIRRTLSGDAVGSHLQRDEETAALLAEHGQAITVVEVDGAFFFGSAGSVENEVRRLTDAGARYVILDLKRVRDVDSTAVRILVRLNDRLIRTGRRLCVSYVQPERRRARQSFEGEERRRGHAPRQIWLKLRQFGAVAAIGEDNFFADTDSALRQAENLLLAELADGVRPAGAARRAGILAGLTRDDVRTIRGLSERHRYGPGDVIFEQGATGDAVYFLARGRADVLIDIKRHGRRLRISTLSAGSVFGEMAFLDPMPRSATVVADTETVCYRLGAEVLERLAADDPRLALQLMRNMCLIFTTRLRAANLAIVELEG